MPGVGLPPLRRTWRVADAAAAGLLAALALAEVAGGAYDGRPLSPAIAAAVSVAATLPSAVRRRAPLPVLAATFAPLWVLTALRSDVFPFAVLLAMMLVTYTVAASCDRRTAVTGLVVAIVSAEANAAAAPATEAGDLLFPLLLLTVPWAAGRALRTWRKQAAELLAANEALARERQLSAQLAVQAERGNIARDLHDTLVQSLNIVVVHAEAAEEALAKDAARARVSIHRIQQVGRSALDDVRGMLGMLREHGSVLPPPQLAGLDDLYEELRSAGITVEVRTHGQLEPLQSQVETTLYRLVQEALTNVQKHAQARHVEVRLNGRAEDIELEVADDGNGLAPTGSDRSWGLVGMRERVAILGGRLTTQQRPEGGMLVHAVLPRHRL